jgi:YggT family protein
MEWRKRKQKQQQQLTIESKHVKCYGRWVIYMDNKDKTTAEGLSAGLSDPITEHTVTTSTTLPPQDVVETTKTVVPPAGTPEPLHKVFQKKKTIFRAYQVIWYILAVLEILLGLRMALKALGANPDSGFAIFIYALSGPFVAPFNGLFPVSATRPGVIFEWSTIIAAAVYALVAFGVVQLIHMLKPVSKQEVEHTVDEA